MKAVVWIDYGRLEVKDVPAPVPGPSDILVSVKAAGLCTTDAGMIEHGFLDIVPPVIIGHEAAGIVVETGADVSGISVGDRVALDPPVPCRRCKVCLDGYEHLCPNTLHIGCHTGGGLAEYITIDHRNAYRIPDNVSYREAALAEPVAVCLEGLARAGDISGKSVVILGDGAFGNIFSQLAVLYGASSILAVGHHDSRLDKIAQDKVQKLNSRKGDTMAAVMSMTEGLGADVVVDAVGSARVLEEYGLRMCAPRGTLVIFSAIGEKVPLDLLDLYLKELSIVGSCRSLRQFGKGLELIGNGGVSVRRLITQVMAPEEAEKGFKLMRTDKENTIKVVVEFD